MIMIMIYFQLLLRSRIGLEKRLAPQVLVILPDLCKMLLVGL